MFIAKFHKEVHEINLVSFKLKEGVFKWFFFSGNALINQMETPTQIIYYPNPYLSPSFCF